jgi:hypothetical protein
MLTAQVELQYPVYGAKQAKIEKVEEKEDTQNAKQILILY